jgi:hypothetical protein
MSLIYPAVGGAFAGATVVLPSVSLARSESDGATIAGYALETENRVLGGKPRPVFLRGAYGFGGKAR